MKKNRGNRCAAPDRHYHSTFCVIRPVLVLDQQELVQQRTSRPVWTCQVVSALPIRQKTVIQVAEDMNRYCV